MDLTESIVPRSDQINADEDCECVSCRAFRAVQQRVTPLTPTTADQEADA